MAPKLTLTYFPLHGRAEPIRLACAIGKVAFTNKTVKGPEYAALKDSLPLGQLPVLEIEEEGKEKYTMAQSQAIFRYVAKIGGLYPSDPIMAGKVDVIMETFTDLMAPLQANLAGAIRTCIREEAFTDEEKKEIRTRIVEKHFPGLLEKLEGMAKAESGWMVGDSVTIADIFLFTSDQLLRSGFVDHVPVNLFEAYPTLKSIVDKVAALPEVKSWYENHPMPYGTFDYAP